MRRRIRLALLVALISACWLTAEAQSLKLDVQEHTLKNGMKVLMLERHKTPTVACRINFRVGSSDERPGITGISHFLEHMMFKGTKIVGIKDFVAEQKLVAREEKLVAAVEAEEAKGVKADKAKLDGLRKDLDALRQEWRKLIVKDELWATYLKHGASGLNASTGDDATYYYCDLPSNKLELWAFLESDRMRNPVLREFYSERDVIKEERRMRVDNSPFGVLFEQLGATAFTAHPYGWPTIGWMSDISSLRKDETLAYFRRYYAPNNAVAVLVGDIHPPDVLKLMEKHFGDIPSQTPPPKVSTVEPEQKGERRVYVEFDAEPQFVVAYHQPALGHPDVYVLDVIDAILSEGRTSRLYKTLIEQKRIAVSARAYSGGSKYPDLFLVLGTPRSPHTVDEVEKAIYDEIEKLKTEPPSERELQKIKNQMEAAFIRKLKSNSGLANEIGSYEVTYNWQYLNTLLERLQAVTGDDVMRVAKQYLTRSNRTVAVLEKKPKAAK